jgi:Flp pilus assembly protein TadB
MLIFSRISKERSVLKHALFTKPFYKAFIPIVRKLKTGTCCDRRLSLIYCREKSTDIQNCDAAVKCAVFAIMLFLPAIALYICPDNTKIIIFAFLVPFLAVRSIDMDLGKKYEAMRNSILNDYSDYLTKITLYIGSGHSLYQALMQDDETAKSGSIFNNEVSIMRNRLSLKSSPEDALRKLSESIPLPEINGFVSLMIQGYRNGESGLDDILKNYTGSVWQERKNNAKKTAEQASAKVIFALVIGLIGIILVLVTPAILMLRDIG